MSHFLFDFDGREEADTAMRQIAGRTCSEDTVLTKKIIILNMGTGRLLQHE
jgi:hypothetical protein